MKYAKYALIALSALTFAACNDVNEQEPQGGTLTADQLQQTNEAIESRIEATFAGMFTMMGEPLNSLSSDRPDDFGFVMMALSNDLEAADAWIGDNGYNWFSTCGKWSSRNPNYANPYIRYIAPYKQIKIANDVIGSYEEGTTDPTAMNRIAQAKACRAYDYMNLAPYFQFNYVDHKDDPCVPLVTEKTLDAATNPRATVEEVYKQIIEDLDYACEVLEDYKPTNKNMISGAVAYGLRARANLNMEKWAEAAADAQKAIELSGAQPASIAEVSTPSFCNIEDHNWLWGYDMTVATQQIFPYATVCSWTCSFSGDSYSAAVACYVHINKLLYDQISATDVRKGWWLDEELHSPLLDGLTWDAGESGSASGQAISEFEYDDKLAFVPYTNVKFGCTPIGTNDNAEDMPLMRVEEMLLIQAEAYAKSGNPGKATQILESFVKTYRDPSYTAAAGGRSLADEIWFQRRVELWGEGFAILDTKRLQKPMVRFLGTEESTNVSPAFRFNMAADDGWLLMRFTNNGMNTNFSIVDNTDGSLPKMDQNPDLRDGVTD